MLTKVFLQKRVPLHILMTRNFFSIWRWCRFDKKNDMKGYINPRKVGTSGRVGMGSINNLFYEISRM